MAAVAELASLGSPDAMLPLLINFMFGVAIGFIRSVRWRLFLCLLISFTVAIVLSGRHLLSSGEEQAVWLSHSALYFVIGSLCGIAGSFVGCLVRGWENRT